MTVLDEGVRIEQGYRMDMVVDARVLVEVKILEQVLPIHRAQMSTYLRLSGLEAGLLLNFNVVLFKDGVRRFNR